MNESTPEYDFRGGNVIPRQSLKACGLDPAKGPTVQMTRADHRDTGTYGMDEDAVEPRQQITERVQTGDHGVLERLRYYRGECRLASPAGALGR